jgi:uncharacterized membrane protein
LKRNAEARGLLGASAIVRAVKLQDVASATPAATRRFDRLDALRGTAIVWMACFHFCFDLNYFGWIHQNFYRDPLWTVQRSCIVSLFLLCAGMGQAVATEQRQGWPRFWRRWAQVAGCAVLVSAGSWFVFPRSYIYFGVLHGIAVMLVLLRLGAPLGRWLWPLGAAAIALPHFVQSPIFDSRWTNWTGLITHKPITEDYVPLLPWIGVMAFGLALGRWVLQQHPAWMQGRIPRVLHPLAVLGRWSLTFYMVHQPVLFGLLWLVSRLH